MLEVSTSKRESILSTFRFGYRLDGRQLFDARVIDAKFGDSPGDIDFSLGSTRVAARITANVSKPQPHRPREGFLVFTPNLDILNEPEQSNSGDDTRKSATEIKKILDRIIKGSKYVLFLTPSLTNNRFLRFSLESLT
jgi:exosome complex component RRP45